jgi:hypothetical protein
MAMQKGHFLVKKYDTFIFTISDSVKELMKRILERLQDR